MNTYSHQHFEKVAQNSLQVQNGDIMTIENGAMRMALAGEFVEGVAVTSDTFASDNETGEKRMVNYRPIFRQNTYKLEALPGQIFALTDVGFFFNIAIGADGRQYADVGSKNNQTGQFRLEGIIDQLGSVVEVRFVPTTGSSTIPASSVTYDNTTSGSPSTNAQEALDELFECANDLKTDVAQNQSNITQNQSDIDDLQALSHVAVTTENSIDIQFTQSGTDNQTISGTISESTDADNIIHRGSDGKIKVKELAIEASSQPLLGYDPITRELQIKSLAVTNVVVDDTNPDLATSLPTTYATGTELQEGDILIITQTGETYIHNGGTLGDANDFTLIEVPGLTTTAIRALFSSANTALDYNPTTGVFSVQLDPVGTNMLSITPNGLLVTACNIPEVDDPSTVNVDETYAFVCGDTNTPSNNGKKVKVRDLDLAKRTFDVNQASHGFSVGEVISYQAGGWVLAHAIDENHIATHLVVEVTDPNNFTVAGTLPTDLPSHGYTDGALLYTDQTTAGEVTEIKPTTGIVNLIMQAYGPDQVFVQDYIYSTISGDTAPVLVPGTSTASNIQQNQVDLNTTDVFTDGGVPITDEGWVVYPSGSDENDPSAVSQSNGGTNPHTFTGLTAGTNYCAKPYATNTIGTTYGSEVCFSTVAGFTPSTGSLDPTFNGAGYNSAVTTVQKDSTGKYVTGGVFSAFGGQVRGKVARMTNVGALDTSFVPTGTGFNTNVNNLAIQADDKVVVVGQFLQFNGTIVNRIARLNTDGSLDTGFLSNTGTGFGTRTGEWVDIQADGKIVVGGTFTTIDGTPASRIVRLNADGTVDTAFMSNVGSGFNNTVKCVKVLQNGKIMVSGIFTQYNGTTRNRIARLNADGTLDTSFNPGVGPNSLVEEFDIQPDGKIVIIGIFSQVSGNARSRIARLNADGTLDTSFNVGSGLNNFVYGIICTTDGKTIIGGNFTQYNGSTVGRLVRINNDGSEDTAFSSNVGTGFDNQVWTITEEPSGSFVVSGGFSNYNGTPVDKVVRII